MPSSGGKRILDRYLNMFVPRILRRCVVDENVFVRRNCKPDMDLEAGAVTVLVTRCDHSYAASDDAMIVFLQPVCLTIDYGAHGLRRIGPFERHLQWDLHNGLSISIGSFALFRCISIMFNFSRRPAFKDGEWSTTPSKQK